MSKESLRGLDVDIDEIERIIKGYCSEQKIIVVTGEFSSGKSSFINCFLNRRAFLPYGKTECTPILIDIYEGDEGKIEVRKKDGNTFEEDLSNDNIIKYAKYVEGDENDVVSLAIPLRNSGLPENTHIIDTPGTNTVLKEHENITKYVIKRADAVLYLFNRVISKTDIEHINDILRYTPNIIYILTHSDEIDTKTGQKYTRERIEELIGEARKEISASTHIDEEDLVIYSVGSEYGFEDRSEIEAIGGLIAYYISLQSDERRRRVAQKKIEKILQTALDGYILKKELLSKQKEMTEYEITGKIKKFEQEYVNYEKKHNNRVEDIDRRMIQQEEFCRSEFQRLLSEERTSILLLMSDSDVSEKIVEKQLEKNNTEISNKMRKLIEESIMKVTKDAYDSANSSLDEIVGDFSLSVPFVISAPEIKELDDSKISTSLAIVEKQIEENLRELEYLKEKSNEEERIEIEKQIRMCELQKENIADKVLQLGVYHPEFISIENEGGEKVGRITGRIIGEVADIALLLWNPVGGVVKGVEVTAKGAKTATKGAKVLAKGIEAADKAKDVVTIMRYVKDASTKVAKKGKEVADDVAKKGKEVATTIKKVDNGRREVIERIQDNFNEEEKSGVSLSTMLDMLSIGHWTEKLGGAIGEAIKPSTTSFVEDMEIKALYESNKAELISESRRLSDELYDLKCRLNEVDDFGKQLSIENEIKEKNKALEEKKCELEEMKLRAEKKNVEDQVKNHLISLFDEYETIQLEKGTALIQAIINKAKIEIIERLTLDYYEKLDYYKQAIEELRNSSLNENNDIVECEEKISKLQQSITEVGDWLE